MMKLFADGGVVLKNPSEIGGTWACVAVDNDTELFRASGFISREALGMPVTNNYTELLAVVEGIEAFCMDGWRGVILTDSNVTRCRLVSNAKMNGIPNSLRDRLNECKRRLGPISVTLLAGHPTKAQLACGFGRHGLPVSKWNVLCDKLCREAIPHK
jgi:ribonuclease HI